MMSVESEQHQLDLSAMGAPHDSMSGAENDMIEMLTPTSSCKQSPSQSSSGGNHSHSKRPPRKSTLTQQQKNQKRQRATQDQLNILEVEFNKNPTPTASVRDRIADEINMTERSVQIWFQNRYVRFISLFGDCASLTQIDRQPCQDQAVGQEKHRNWRRY